MKKSGIKILGLILILVIWMKPSAVTAAEDDPGMERLSGEISWEEDSKIKQFSISVGNSPFINETYIHNSVYDGSTIKHGIDVSRYQKNINWGLVKASGVEFAIIRVGFRGYGADGNLAVDEYYKQNIEGALAVGIDVGVYIFSQAITPQEAIQEAEYVLSRISGYPITMPVVLDYEYASVSGGAGGRLYDAKLSKNAATEICQAFCQRVEAVGYQSMVYANSSMLNNQLNAEVLSNQYKIWLANYTTETTYTGKYSMWQYTSKGVVPGIEGYVDCNFLYEGGYYGGNPTTELPEVVEAPVINLTSQYQTTSSIELSWEKSDNVIGYEIHRYNPDLGQYEYVTSVDQMETPTFLEEDLIPGKEYRYQMFGSYFKNTDVSYGAISNELITATIPEQVMNVTAPSRTDTRIRLNWDKTEQAMGYQIYRYDPETGLYKKAVTISNVDILSYVDTGRETGKTHKYKIRAFVKAGGMNYFGGFSNVLVTGTKPEKPTGFKSTAQTKTNLTLNWKKVKGITGYQVYRGKGGVYTKVKTITSPSATSYTNGSLAAGTAYKYKIRAYKVVNGETYYGAFSSIIKVNTKKK